jgi:hypothetical protein
MEVLVARTGNDRRDLEWSVEEVLSQVAEQLAHAGHAT